MNSVRSFLLALLTCSLLPACQRAASRGVSAYLRERVGEVCTVQFRRDALGSGATLPVSPTTNEINGAQVSLSGKLVAVESEGIMIDSSTPSQRFATCWIPLHSILLVEVPKPY